MPDDKAQADREGGREENPDAASPFTEKSRNSSGSASLAASVLDMRQRLILHQRVMAELCRLMGLQDMLRELEREQQRGFRRNRG